MHHITKSPPKFKQPEGACVLQEKIEFRGLGYVAEGEKTVRMITVYHGSEFLSQLSVFVSTSIMRSCLGLHREFAKRRAECYSL
jgi:hypothetical protein